ncbi:MAG: nitrite/sulfite reductase [bacterium]|nr:nitrite/sulfite reductase [bacterium]MDY4099220.1 nitrite/sulfite reductase [Lachnospiraceae bacterium]
MDKAKINEWKQKLPEFQQKTDAFFAGELDKGSYKGYSGYFGSYAQKGGQASMLRLRTPAGRIKKETLAVIANMLRTHEVPRLHFTTCQTIQLHDLKTDALYPLMEEALDNNIIIMGGGGDYPRNTMCAPLSGVEQGEYFDVLPYAEAASDFALTLIDAEKMPRKLKVAFSNSPANEPHATYRDLGFVANEDGTFDVYSAGGLGGFPKLGVKVAEHIDPDQILYYIKAMWLTFRTYGNYENRAKARTRYMQDALGGPENYADAYSEKLREIYDSDDDLTLPADFAGEGITKVGDGSTVTDSRVISQKQEGLYTVAYHPIGGQPDKDVFLALCDLICEIPEAELRLAPDETAYIVNLTGSEAVRVLALTEEDAAHSPFEASVSCIGASTCQVGVRDSQALLRASVEAVRAANIPANALPKLHISGCPSSCGTHQTSPIGFRGGMKKVDGKPESAFVLNVDGCELQGKESLGRELGAILDADIPKFLVEVGQTVSASGMDFDTWYADNADAFAAMAQKYID